MDAMQLTKILLNMEREIEAQAEVIARLSIDSTPPTSEYTELVAQRYRDDAYFNIMVNALFVEMSKGRYTPTDILQAALMSVREFKKARTQNEAIR